jgi:hypothetical protein
MNFSNLNDEDLLRQARDHNDPLVQELAKRLAERIDGVAYREPSYWNRTQAGTQAGTPV